MTLHKICRPTLPNSNEKSQGYLYEMSKICDSRDFQSEKQKYHLAYKMNCSGEIFNSKWPWCVQLIYDQGPQISLVSLVLCSHTDAVLCTRILLWKMQTTTEMHSEWGRNVPGLVLLPPWRRAAASAQAQIRPFAQGASEMAEPFSWGRHLLLWQRLAQTSKEGLCSALILHLIIPLFTVSRCEEAF